MIPIRQGDGTALVPNGYAEVRKGDGTILWSGSSTQTQPASGVAYWTLDDDDTESGTALDVWNDNDGTINGATTGVSGANQTYTTDEAYSFTTNDNVTVAHNSSLRDAPFSVAFWFKPDTQGNIRPLSIIEGSENENWEFSYRGDNDIGLKFITGSLSSGFQEIQVGANQNTGQWYHAVGVHDGASMELYLDGTSVDSLSVPSYEAGVQDLKIGDSAAGYGNPFEGDIDDVRIYSEALDSQQVSDLYNTGSIGSDTETTSHFASNGKNLPVTGHNMQPQAVYDSTSDKTFAIWQGTDLHPYAAEYDHQASSWSTPVKVGDNPISGQNDNHGVPVLTIDNDGYLRAVYGVHSNKTDNLPNAKSDNKRDATSWTEQADISYPDLGPTYPSLFDDSNDDHHILTRRKIQDGADSSDDDFAISCKRSTDNWGTWSDTDLVDFGLGNRTYPYSKAQNGDKLHLGFTWHDTGGDGNWKNLYHIIIDLTDYSVTTVDGTSLTTPVSKSDADTHAKVVDTAGDGDQLVSSELQLDSNNDPHFTFCRSVSGTAYHYYTHWTGSSWDSPTQITASGSLDAYQSFFINSTSDITAYFTIVNGSRSGDIEKWQYDGSSWSLQSTVYDDGNYAEGASAGQRVRDGLDSFDLLFSQIDNDDYTDNDLKVFGYRTDTDSFVGREQ